MRLIMNIKTILISIFLFLLLVTTASATILPDAFQGYYNQSFVDADITDFEKALVGNYTDVSVSIPDAVDGVAAVVNGNISTYIYGDYACAIWDFSEINDYIDISGNGNDLVATTVLWEQQDNGDWKPHLNKTSEMVFSDIVIGKNSSIVMDIKPDDSDRE